MHVTDTEDREEVGPPTQHKVVVTMTRSEADNLVASLRYVISGGDVRHNEATLAIELMARLMESRVKP